MGVGVAAGRNGGGHGRRRAGHRDHRGDVSVSLAGYIVVTTINAPSPSLEGIVALRPDWVLLAVGDRKTPADWSCDGAQFLSVADQVAFGSRFAEACPYDHLSLIHISEPTR